RIGMAAGGHYVDEGLASIALLEKRLEIRLAGYARIERCMDAAYQGRQVSAENEADLPSRPLGEALPDLRPVPMPGEAVGHEVVRRFGKAEVKLGFAAGAANARLRIGDKVLGI